MASYAILLLPSLLAQEPPSIGIGRLIFAADGAPATFLFHQLASPQLRACGLKGLIIDHPSESALSITGEIETTVNYTNERHSWLLTASLLAIGTTIGATAGAIGGFALRDNTLGIISSGAAGLALLAAIPLLIATNTASITHKYSGTTSLSYTIRKNGRRIKTGKSSARIEEETHSPIQNLRAHLIEEIVSNTTKDLVALAGGCRSAPP